MSSSQNTLAAGNIYPAARLMKQYMLIERRLYGYVISSVPNWADVDDIVQEIVGVMWLKYNTFTPDTNFWAWALQITRYQIMAYRQKKRTETRHFSAQTFALIQDDLMEDVQKDDYRRDALRVCIAKLKKDDRQLLQQRYQEGGSVKKFAKQIQKNVNTLYKLLNRIHIQLHNCVLRSLSQEESQ